jgi:hypothetical protein
LITVIAPIYLPVYPVPMLIPALMAQTNGDFEAIFVHDGPGGEPWEAWKSFFDDPRIRWRETRERGNQFGHDIREMVLSNEQINGRYVWMQNGDNYIVPTAIDMISAQTDDVVCWPITHNYHHYAVMHPKLQIGGIDLSSLAVQTDLALEIGFPWRDHASDWLWIQEIVARTSSWAFLSDCLGVHN